MKYQYAFDCWIVDHHVKRQRTTVVSGSAKNAKDLQGFYKRHGFECSPIRKERL